VNSLRSRALPLMHRPGIPVVNVGIVGDANCNRPVFCPDNKKISPNALNNTIQSIPDTKRTVVF